jgi:hypothetical protein
MSQKLVCFARLEKQAAQLGVGFPDAVPPSDVCRGDLECHACFDELVLELAEVRVRGTEGVGLHHQQLISSGESLNDQKIQTLRVHPVST